MDAEVDTARADGERDEDGESHDIGAEPPFAEVPRDERREGEAEVATVERGGRSLIAVVLAFWATRHSSATTPGTLERRSAQRASASGRMSAS